MNLPDPLPGYHRDAQPTGSADPTPVELTSTTEWHWPAIIAVELFFLNVWMFIHMIGAL